MNEKRNKKISKYLSLLLRHKPETIGLMLDENGWADVESLISNPKIDFNLDELKEVVRTNDKQRFTFNEDQTRIRASQGHSLKEVDLELEKSTPPDVLYHGTVEKFIDSIRKTGLQKMNRNHVHLSADLETANKVAGRRGKPIILEIDTAKMLNDGHEFYLSQNGVWLTDQVEVGYIDFKGL